jgi:hypothetical protein
MVLITVAMGDLVMGVVVTVVLIAAVVLVVAVAVVLVLVMVMVLVTGLLLQVIMTAVQQLQDMAMVEGMAMVEMLLALGLVLAVVMVAPCMEVLMVHMEHTVVVPMEGVPMVLVHMGLVEWGVEPMVAPQVVMVPVDMVLTAERAVVVVGAQVVGVPAGITHMENK